MDLQNGFPLWLQQYKVLFWKNFLLSWRNKRATFLQLFASFFFIFLLFAILKADKALTSSTTTYSRVTEPLPLVSPPIPPCEDKFYVKKPCFDFVWSGNGSAGIGRIVKAIMANNPGRPIPAAKVKSFRTKDEVDVWLYSNPMHCSGALHFIKRNATVISYGIQTNSTFLAKRGKFEDPNFEFQIPLQIAAEREIARSLIGDPNFSWVMALKEFAHPAKKRSTHMETRVPLAFLATSMFGFVFQISSLTAEKELKLRQAMTIMGLYDSAYWLSWLAWEGILTFLSSLFLVFFGMMFMFDMFLKNSFVLFLIFFLFQLNLLGLAFMFSSLMSKSTSSTSVGFSMFIVGTLTQIVHEFGFPYSHRFPITYQVIWSFFPPNLLVEALSVINGASSSSGNEALPISRPAKCAPNNKGCEIMSMNDIYMWLVSTFFLWLALAIYFDNIKSNASGVRKSIFYFLKPGYWTGKGGDKVEGNGICSCISSLPLQEHIPPYDEDVLEEENLVREQTKNGVNDANVAVQVRGLEKTYVASTNISCFTCKKKSPYHALKGLWVNFPKDQLFCLLGPNGAGKTTAINCLTGITPVTGGDALIYGYSIRSSIGMSKIRKLIGVCPQFDTLWDELSGQEHLHLFASIKGLPPSSIQSVIEMSLEKMRLQEAANMRASSYSGGMRRRLSVAIALIGDPKLVILDEPTTGMDPITRRHVWDIIEDAKKGRAIVLTTHSMEEADILGDRIGIMAKGRLRCLGTSIRLKSRFGAGFIANVNFTGGTNGQTPTDSGFVDTSHHPDAVKQFFKHHLDVVPKEENKSFLTFAIPPDREVLLPKFFAELQGSESKFGIADIQLGLTTLEEVFLNISRQAELETSTAEGRLVTLTLTTSGLSVEIPVGARFVGIPGTKSEENPRGIMVEVYWKQDHSGALCISGHSDETPVPPSIEPVASLAATSTRNLLRRGGQVVSRVVIDPNKLISNSQS